MINLMPYYFTREKKKRQHNDGSINHPKKDYLIEDAGQLSK